MSSTKNNNNIIPIKKISSNECQATVISSKDDIPFGMVYHLDIPTEIANKHLKNESSKSQSPRKSISQDDIYNMN